MERTPSEKAKRPPLTGALLAERRKAPALVTGHDPSV
jgi:hypothetical protein